MKKLDINGALSFGFKTFFKKPFLFLGAVIILVIIPAIITNPIKVGVELLSGSETVAQTAYFIVNLLIESSLIAGFITILLKAKREEETSLREFEDKWPFLKEILIGTLLYTGAVFLGTLFFIIPGIWLAVRLQFYNFLIVDQRLKGIDALKESFDITKGYGWPLFFFSFFITTLIVFAGLLVFLVGALVSISVVFLAQTAIYESLFVDKIEESPDNQ